MWCCGTVAKSEGGVCEGLVLQKLPSEEKFETLRTHRPWLC